MQLKWRVIRLTALSCLLFVSIFTLVNIFTEHSSTGNGEGFMLVKPALAQSADASFLEQEAGIAAYVNVGQAIDLTKVRKIYRTVEKETENYLVGSVALPDYATTEDVHVYVNKDGWVVVYYMRDEPVSKIIDWLGSSIPNLETKLGLGVNIATNSMGISVTNIRYYHFNYPNANRLMIIAKSGPQERDEESIFNFTIPNGMAVAEESWSHHLEESKSTNNNLKTVNGYFSASQIKSGTKYQISIKYWHPAYGLGEPKSRVKMNDEQFTELSADIYGSSIKQSYFAIVLVYCE